LLYLAYIHKGDFSAALRSNAEAGGDNVHRGMMLGMLAGVAAEEIPRELLEHKINGFVQLR